MGGNFIKISFFLTFTIILSYCSANDAIPMEECQVNEAVLLNLLEILEAAHKAAEFPIEEINEIILPPNLVTLESCQEAISNIQNLTYNISSEMVMLFRAAIVDSTIYAKLFGSLLGKIDKLTVAINEVGANLDPKMKELFTKVEDAKGAFFEELRNRIPEVEKISNISPQLLTLISTQIMVGDYFEAEEGLTSLNNTNFRDQVVDRVNRKNYLDSLAGYINFLPEHPQRASIFLRWFQNMEDNDELASEKIMVFGKMIKDEKIKMGSDFSPELEAIMGKVVEGYLSLMSIWADKIKSGNYASIVEFGSPRVLSFIGECFHPVIPDIINQAYSPLSFNSYLNFVLSLRWNKHKGTGLEALLSLVEKNSQEHLKIAHKMKLLMNNLSGPDNPEGALEKLNTLKSSFDYNLRCIVWHKTIQLMSVSHNLESLQCMAIEFDVEYNERRVVSSNSSDLSASWEFFREEELADNLYKIRNLGYKMYLSKSSSSYDANQGFVTLSTGEHLWKVKLHRTTDIIISYDNSDMYLFASDVLFLSWKRMPFLWLGSVAIEDSWRVECSE